MTLKEKKEILVDALLNQAGLQKLVDTATGLLGNPMVVVDQAFNVLAFSSDADTNSEPWSIFHTPDYFERCHLQKISDLNDFSIILSSKEPIFRNYSFFDTQRIAMRLADGNEPIGHFVVLEERKPFDDDDWQLIKIVSQVLSCEILQSSSSFHHNSQYHAIINELIKTHGENSKVLSGRANGLHIKFPQEMAVFVFSPIEAQTAGLLYGTCRVLAEEDHDLITTVEDDKIVMIVPKRLSEDPTFFQRIEKRSAGAGLYCGVSDVFSDIIQFYKFYCQAVHAIEILRRNTGNKCCIARYADISIQYMLLTVAKEMDLSDVIAPELRALMKYDEVNQTEYVEDLRVLLRCGRSRPRAARERNIHKNSMYYRIQQIEEILDIDLKNDDLCMRLSFSFLVLSFLNKD